MKLSAQEMSAVMPQMIAHDGTAVAYAPQKGRS
jgi:hypothetical protein